MNIPQITFRDKMLLIASGIAQWPAKTPENQLSFLFRKKASEKQQAKRKAAQKESR